MRAPVYDFESFRLDVAERLLVCGSRPIPLRGKPFDTLRLLLERAGRLVSRDELMQAVWPDATVDANNLEQNLSVLRKIFRQNHPEKNFIETVYRKGYRFLAEVRCAEEQPPALSVMPMPEVSLRSLSSRLRLRRDLRGVSRSGDARGQAVRPLGREDDELRRLARELQASAVPLLIAVVQNMDRMADEADGDSMAELLSETTELTDEFASQLRAHLLPILYLTRQPAVRDFFTCQEHELGAAEQLRSVNPPHAGAAVARYRKRRASGQHPVVTLPA